MIDPVRLFHPSKAERIAVVSVDDASAKGAFVILVAKGKKRTAMTDSKMLGPFSAEELVLAHKSIVDSLLAEGYVHGGLGQLLMALGEKSPRVRARAAMRIAWRRETAAAEPLIKLLDKPKDDVSTIIETLGLLGDARAIPVVKTEAEKKLLSRRRAGVEALLHLRAHPEVAPLLADARKRALERLPASVRPHAEAGAWSNVEDASKNVDMKERGICADTLYELAGILQEPRLTQIALGMLTVGTLHQPHTWRYTKSVWKRAMTRRDFATFGVLAYRIEIAGRANNHGVVATLKSGYDGETRPVRVFGRAAVDYVRRRSWRYLRRLAQHESALYPAAAAEAIVHYTDGDDVMKGNSPATGRSYLLHRVLFGASSKYSFDGRQMRWKTKRPQKSAPSSSASQAQAQPGRDEPFAALWDRRPQAFVRLLGGARHSQVQKFALEGILRTPAALQSASHAEVAALLESDDARVVDLGLVELRRRFDPARPDLQLVYDIAGSTKDLIRNHGLAWLADTSSAWLRDPAWIVKMLGMPHPASREAAARIVNGGVRAALAEDARKALAAQLLAAVERKEPEEGAWNGVAAVLREGLLDEAAAACPIARAINLVENGGDSAISVGASILSKKPGAYDVLGFSKVLALATHDKAAVRRAAMKLLEGAADALAKDPSALFGLVESDWDDVRTEALALLDHIDLLPLGLDGLLGLADSTRVDVQLKAHKIIDQAIRASGDGVQGVPGFDVHELLARLGQHPSPVTRKYAVAMAVQYLKPGFVRLAKLELLFRSALIDVNPDRQVKRTVIELLGERGLQDENQAEVAAGILGDFLRTQCVDDRERALAALVKIKLKFPQVDTPLLQVREKHSSSSGTGASA